MEKNKSLSNPSDRISKALQTLRILAQEIADTAANPSRKLSDLFHEDCKIARHIRADRNWEYSTFFNYSKPKRLPKPRNLRKAARKRATQKKSREDLVVLTQRRQ